MKTIPELIEYIWTLMERNTYLDKIMYWVECNILDRVYSKRILRHLQPAIQDIRNGNFVVYNKQIWDKDIGKGLIEHSKYIEEKFKQFVKEAADYIDKRAAYGGNE